MSSDRYRARVSPESRDAYKHPTCEHLEPRLLYIQDNLDTFNWQGKQLRHQEEVIAKADTIRLGLNPKFMPKKINPEGELAFIKNPNSSGTLPLELSSRNAIVCIDGIWYAAKPGPQNQWYTARPLDLEAFPELTSDFLQSLLLGTATRS